MDHRVFRELAAGAALDDLEPTETATLAGHLATCATCRRDSIALADVAGLVALAAPARRPPETLRGSVLAAIAAADQPAAPRPRLVAGPSVTGRPDAPVDLATAAGAARLRASARRWRAAGIIAIAASVVLALASGSLIVQNRALDGQLSTAAAERDAAVARLAESSAAMTVVLAPDHETAALQPESLAPSAVAYVVYRPGQKDAWLMATGLPATPSGSVYELWAADATGVHAGPTFTCAASGPCLAQFGMDLRGMSAAMVTLEPAGGAVTEPGPQLVFGNL
ncbi:MAG: anti-sigma factor [Candidatus Limnocylindrales bacterium]|jgi:hypothetical protein|nr:anti-sigma factor [Candidatus Limnocylindrales bacterium]